MSLAGSGRGVYDGENEDAKECDTANLYHHDTSNLGATALRDDKTVGFRAKDWF